MGLIDIKNYLVERRVATLGEIAASVSMDLATTRGMLDVWVRKGKVTIQRTAKCSGCNSNTCNAGDPVEVFRWQD